jgi:hypothetical protein
VLIRRRTSRAKQYRWHVANTRLWAGLALDRANRGRSQAQAHRLYGQPLSRREYEREAEHWLELCYYWRERLREYLQGVDW